ncbi:MAG: hypothetical protein R3C53_28100, partial [Pirellulaceae bacterium]
MSHHGAKLLNSASENLPDRIQEKVGSSDGTELANLAAKGMQRVSWQHERAIGVIRLREPQALAVGLSSEPQALAVALSSEP